MSEQASIPLVPPPHRSEDKLYNSNLDACIEGIQNFPVTKRRSSPCTHFTIRPFAKRAVASPTPVEPSGSLPSPPPSPQRQMWSSSPISSPSVTASMSRPLLHGGPARGHQGARPTQDARSSQDALSNFAVQPAANAGTFKLKKNAVKIVSAAGPAPSAPLPKAPLATAAPIPSKAATSFLTPVPLPALRSGTQHAAAKENQLPRRPQVTVKPTPSPSVATLPPSNIERPSQIVVVKDSLDDMFARLSGASPLVPSRPANKISLAGPDKSVFPFDDRANTMATTAKVASRTSPEVQNHSHSASELPSTERPRDNVTHAQPLSATQQAPSIATCQGETQDDREKEYLDKAATYFSTLPTRPGDSAHIIKTVATKLHIAYTPNLAKLQPEEVEKLRARYVFAVTNYINKKIKLGLEPLTADLVKKVFCNSEGDFLQLCAALVKGGYIVLNDLKQVTDLCQTILDVLPKADSSLTVETSSKASQVDESTNLVASSIPVFNVSSKILGDPLEDMTAWPTQEKREHGAIYRACVLKGVGGVKSLNQLQALVWGGRLESIQMPELGSEHALVKFLTPKACQTYLDATENGIEMQGGEKKTIVFVDKQPGPNSINDVIQNCIEGDASRCVRATGADDDWSDGALVKLARGRQSIPRDVDRVKQGKTARGHHYIEFRFGNIYHALNFRRHLMDDEDWEHCSIGYAKDPCELACGVHYKDADEEGGSCFA